MEIIFYKDRIKYVQKTIETDGGKFLIEHPYFLSDHKFVKNQEFSSECHAAIVSGVDVTLSDGTTAHFSLEETDQINLAGAVSAIQNGATEYPYHADGELCKMYSADDISLINSAATQHKFEQMIYCHLLMAWADRAETAEELEQITYGAELPEDLAENMAQIMTASAQV